MLCRTLLRMLRCTRSRLVVVRPVVISNIESRKRVRRRRRGKRVPADSVREERCAVSRGEFTESANEFVSHAMYRAEMYGARRILLQFLTEFENVIVNGTGRRIVLVAPYFVQQFVATDDPVGILHQKLKRLELLSGQDYGLSVAFNLHLLEVGGDSIEALHLDIGSARGVAKSGTDTRQQFPRAKWFGDVIVCPQLEQQHFVRDVAG